MLGSPRPPSSGPGSSPHLGEPALPHPLPKPIAMPARPPESFQGKPCAGGRRSAPLATFFPPHTGTAAAANPAAHRDPEGKARSQRRHLRPGHQRTGGAQRSAPLPAGAAQGESRAIKQRAAVWDGPVGAPLQAAARGWCRGGAEVTAAPPASSVGGRKRKQQSCGDAVHLLLHLTWVTTPRKPTQTQSRQSNRAPQEKSSGLQTVGEGNKAWSTSLVLQQHLSSRNLVLVTHPRRSQN